MDLRRVDLNLLVAFDALLEERSVTKAADRLAVGQSAMSSTLSRLRLLFNDPLLVRQGRGLVATSVAEELVDPVRDILATVSATLSRCGSFDPTSDSRSFSIIASDYLTLVFLRPFLASLANEAPNVVLNIRPVGDASLGELRQNKADLLITAREAFEHADNFPHEMLFTDRYVCAVDANHASVHNIVTADQFQSLPYLATSAGGRPSIGDMELNRLGVQRNTEITTSFTLGFFLLPGTQLISLVHERLGRSFERQLNIRLLECPFPLRPITEMMIWTPRSTEDPGHRWLRQRLLDLARANFS